MISKTRLRISALQLVLVIIAFLLRPSLSHAASAVGTDISVNSTSPSPARPAAPSSGGQRDLGACCLPDGSCVEEDDYSCCLSAGFWFGSMGCPGPCVDLGACCLPDGSCISSTVSNCEGQEGIFSEGGVVCDPSFCAFPAPPAWGRCWRVVSGCLLCTMVASQVYCPYGWRFERGKTCTDLGKTGACCEADGNCTILTDYECIVDGGTFEGGGSSCLPDPCPPVPVKPGSWGRVKSVYR